MASLGLLGVPSCSAAHRPGQEKAPAALGTAGLIGLLAETGHEPDGSTACTLASGLAAALGRQSAGATDPSLRRKVTPRPALEDELAAKTCMRRRVVSFCHRRLTQLSALRQLFHLRSNCNANAFR
jgi:hypothetical protein